MSYKLITLNTYNVITYKTTHHIFNFNIYKNTQKNTLLSNIK